MPREGQWGPTGVVPRGHATTALSDERWCQVQLIVKERTARSALLEVFYENAHHKELSGDRARHAGLARRDPRTTIVMPLEEARKLVRRVVFAWMDAK